MIQKSNSTDEDLPDFMSGNLEIDEDDRPHSNLYSNIWTTARVAFRRQKIEWQFNDGLPQLKYQDLVLKSSSRRKILFTIRNRLRQDRALALTSKPDQGKAMQCVPSVQQGRPGDPASRNKSCEAHSRAWQLRHDGIQNRVLVAARNSTAKILSVNQRIVKSINLRPDIVLKLNNKIYIVDITCPFENRLDGFEKAKQEKIHKYQVLIDHLLPQAAAVEIVPIVVGALGAWDPANDKFLGKIMAKSYLKKMSQLCVSDNFRWARDIYVEHITGHRQFDESAIVNNPAYRPQEPLSQDDPLAVPINSPPPPGNATDIVLPVESLVSRENVPVASSSPVAGPSGLTELLSYTLVICGDCCCILLYIFFLFVNFAFLLC
ncbi:hypothetical protein AVEN_110406-1 [Araneus ventricosus]|uniref:Uncharacterized protein n=1 Tax=Araneus ventricosus TaxID=182803 RepID=A0A4Y2P9B2_ARAVE|nr:hypothetical protein AVEN_110406-1 [Araneus ventricosus]